MTAQASADGTDFTDDGNNDPGIAVHGGRLYADVVVGEAGGAAVTVLLVFACDVKMNAAVLSRVAVAIGIRYDRETGDYVGTDLNFWLFCLLGGE